MCNSLKARSAVVLLCIVIVAVTAQQQCQPDKVQQLLKEIQACRSPSSGDSNPEVPRGFIPVPQRPSYPGGFPGGDAGSYLGQGGGGGQGIGILVSRPIPADVRPISGEGLPNDSQFFLAGPRMRPNSGAGGGGGGFPFFLSGGPSGRGNPPQDQRRTNAFPPTDFNFGQIGGSGGFPSLFPPFGNPFEGAAGGDPRTPTTTFEIEAPAGPESLPFDFNEILRILKALEQDIKKNEAGDGEGDGKGEREQPGTSSENPDSEMNPETTEGIIDVDTTMSPTTEQPVTEESSSTPSAGTTVVPTAAG